MITKKNMNNRIYELERSINGYDFFSMRKGLRDDVGDLKKEQIHLDEKIDLLAEHLGLDFEILYPSKSWKLTEKPSD